LIEAATGAHLWADRFDGELSDIFELQDEMTARIVGAIAPKELDAGIALIDRARELNPNFATAWSSSAWARNYRGEAEVAIELSLGLCRRCGHGHQPARSLSPVRLA
jgi:adenylate cyclase